MRKVVLSSLLFAVAATLVSCASAPDAEPQHGQPYWIPITVANEQIVDPGDDRVRARDYVAWYVKANRLEIEFEEKARGKISVQCDKARPNQERVICTSNLLPADLVGQSFKYAITVWRDGKQIGPLDPKIIVDP